MLRITIPLLTCSFALTLASPALARQSSGGPSTIRFGSARPSPDPMLDAHKIVAPGGASLAATLAAKARPNRKQAFKLQRVDSSGAKSVGAGFIAHEQKQPTRLKIVMKLRLPPPQKVQRGAEEAIGEIDRIVHECSRATIANGLPDYEQQHIAYATQLPSLVTRLEKVSPELSQMVAKQLQRLAMAQSSEAVLISGYTSRPFVAAARSLLRSTRRQLGYLQAKEQPDRQQLLRDAIDDCDSVVRACEDAYWNGRTDHGRVMGLYKAQLPLLVTRLEAVDPELAAVAQRHLQELDAAKPTREAAKIGWNRYTTAVSPGWSRWYASRAHGIATDLARLLKARSRDQAQNGATPQSRKQRATRALGRIEEVQHNSRDADWLYHEVQLSALVEELKGVDPQLAKKTSSQVEQLNNNKFDVPHDPNKWGYRVAPVGNRYWIAGYIKGANIIMNDAQAELAKIAER